MDPILTQGMTGSQEVPEPSRRWRLPTLVETQSFSWVGLLLPVLPVRLRIAARRIQTGAHLLPCHPLQIIQRLGLVRSLPHQKVTQELSNANRNA